MQRVPSYTIFLSVRQRRGWHYLHNQRGHHSDNRTEVMETAPTAAVGRALLSRGPRRLNPK